MWMKVFADEKPPEIDKTSSKVYNYLTKEAEQVELENPDGQKVKAWQYQQLAVPKDVWEICEKTISNSGRIDDTENAVCDASTETEERLADLENALCELSAQKGA